MIDILAAVALALPLLAAGIAWRRYGRSFIWWAAGTCAVIGVIDILLFDPATLAEAGWFSGLGVVVVSLVVSLAAVGLLEILRHDRRPR